MFIRKYCRFFLIFLVQILKLIISQRFNLVSVPIEHLKYVYCIHSETSSFQLYIFSPSMEYTHYTIHVTL